MTKNILVPTLLVLLASGSASALSFSGDFLADDDVVLIDFTLDAPGVATLRTLGYAGGTNEAGDTIAAGGFDPILSLFDGAGSFLDLSDDAVGVPADPATGQAYDAELVVALAAGTYTVALTQFDNVPVGDLGDGFLLEGLPSLTAVFGCSNGSFCDDTGANRSGAWALDILGLGAAVAEPGLALLLTPGLALLGLGLRAPREPGVARRPS